MITAVSPSAGSASRRRSRVVLPEPRNPVRSVTGVKAGTSLTMAGIQLLDQFARERIAASAAQLFGHRPEMTKVLDDLALAGEGRQQKRRALPIRELHSVKCKHKIGNADALRAFAPATHRIRIARVDAFARRRIRPMLIGTEHTAQRTHLFLPCLFGNHYFLRGDRLAKSSAISFIVTNRTPACE